MNRLIRTVAAHPEKSISMPLYRLLFQRRFSEKTSQRLLILFETNRISYASIFPFLECQKELLDRYGVELRCVPVADILREGIPKKFGSATHVLAQTWLTDPLERQQRLNSVLKALPEGVITGYLDSFANCDLRLTAIFQDIDFYFKKSLFCQFGEFVKPTLGHTNLTDFYSRLYNLECEPNDWHVNPNVFSKLRLAPHFLTDPGLSLLFRGSPPFSVKDRYIDVHARLGGTNSSGWYGEMRRHAARVVDELTGLHVATGTGVAQRAFRKELMHSKVCFSPFGYGEICWRDIEAIATGALLIKPDMSHLRTQPDLYRDGETYIACRWDFGDLREKIGQALKDEERRQTIAQNAFIAAQDYLKNCGPVSAYADFLEPAGPGASGRQKGISGHLQKI